jgi:hypothetical protein
MKNEESKNGLPRCYFLIQQKRRKDAAAIQGAGCDPEKKTTHEKIPEKNSAHYSGSEKTSAWKV